MNERFGDNARRQVNGRYDLQLDTDDRDGCEHSKHIIAGVAECKLNVRPRFAIVVGVGSNPDWTLPAIFSLAYMAHC